VSIPASVTRIEGRAFENNQLTSVTLRGGISFRTVAGGGAGGARDVFFKDIFDGNNITELTITGGSIIPDRFSSSNMGSRLTKLTLLEGVTSIWENAFSGHQLTSVTIPESVTSIGERAFADNQLTSVTIPTGITSIGENAFANNRLTSVTIPASVISLGGFASNQLTSITIPAGVTSVGASAFANNQLTSVTIPAGVTSVGASAFANNQLTSISIPAGVRTIGSSAFAGNRLTSVTIPAGVTSIGENAFANNRLTSVTIPAGVTSIGKEAFGNFNNYHIYSGLGGTYEYRNNQYYYNNTAVPDPAILRLGPNVWLVRIDGKSADLFYNEGLSEETEDNVRRRLNNWSADLPANWFYGSTRSTRPVVYLPPGQHTIEAIYLENTATGISYSVNTRVWEQRYLFEGDTYEITATVSGDRINWGITRQ